MNKSASMFDLPIYTCRYVNCKTGGKDKPTLIHCTKEGILPVDMTVAGRHMEMKLPCDVQTGMLHEAPRPGYAFCWDHAGPFPVKTWGGNNILSLKVCMLSGKLAPDSRWLTA